jgi:ribonuclease R
MLTANEAVATYLSAKGIPCVYRVHEPPSALKLSDCLEYLKSVGITVKAINSEKVSSEDLGVISQIVEEKGLMAPLSYSMLRAM